MIPYTEFSEDERKELLARRPDVLNSLLGNVCHIAAQDEPVLLVGAGYNGIWLEHNQDNLFLAEYAPDAAWSSQLLFMRTQREDGLLAYHLPITHKNASYAQVQCVYPFARCAFEVAKYTNRAIDDFRRIYDVAARYDAWMEKYRNRRGTGLVEMYCEYDTGHDNSPRVTDGGIPRCCPDCDAANMPDLPLMPVLSVDLSAMCYGNRIALAEIADYLGMPEEAVYWRSKAEKLQELIRKHLYCAEDDYYYDVDSNGFRRYRTEHLTRLFLNEVLSQEEFDRLYRKYFEDERHFMTAFPYPSVSVSDPHFNSALPVNCWGSNTQALTSLRALLWLKKYHRQDECTALLRRWMRTFLEHPGEYRQELNPFTGTPIGDGKNYSPTLILYLEGLKVL